MSGIKYYAMSDSGEERYQYEVEREQWEMEHDPAYELWTQEQQENTLIELYNALEQPR